VKKIRGRGGGKGRGDGRTLLGGKRSDRVIQNRRDTARTRIRGRDGPRRGRRGVVGGWKERKVREKITGVMEARTN